MFNANLNTTQDDFAFAADFENEGKLNVPFSTTFEDEKLHNTSVNLNNSNTK